jgi:hypothetical protein
MGYMDNKQASKKPFFSRFSGTDATAETSAGQWFADCTGSECLWQERITMRRLERVSAAFPFPLAPTEC